MNTNHPTPAFDREPPPYGSGHGPGGLNGPGGGNPDEPTEPAWADVLAGIWDRLANPLPR